MDELPKWFRILNVLLEKNKKDKESEEVKCRFKSYFIESFIYYIM